jgi:hypothetical protein
LNAEGRAATVDWGYLHDPANAGKGLTMSALAKSADQIDYPDYPCESCRREYSPPRPRTGAGLRGGPTILAMALGHSLRHRQGLRSTYRSIRPRMIARWNDEAFQGFVDGFRMCGECRGFICSRCWDGKRRVCSACLRAANEARRDARAATRRGRASVKAHAETSARLALVPARTVDFDEAGRPRRRRPTFGLGFLLRPGPARTVTSVALMVFSLALGALEVAYYVVTRSA